MSDDNRVELETKMMVALLANPAVVDIPDKSVWDGIVNMAMGADRGAIPTPTMKRKPNDER